MSLVLVMLGTAILAVGATRVEREFGYRTLLGADFPPIAALEAFVARYGGGFPVYVVWSCEGNGPCTSALDPLSLEMAKSVEEEMRLVPGVRDVLSPASAPVIVPDHGGFAVRRFGDHDLSVADHSVLARRVQADPFWVGTLISKSAAVGSLVVMLSDARSKTMERVVDALDVALEPFRSLGFEYHLVGHPIASVVAGRELADSTSSLVPYIAVVMAVVILGLTGSLYATLITMGTMGVGLVSTLGLLGWLRWPQDSVLQVLAPLILVVGVCDAVHFLSQYRQGVTAASRKETIIAAARQVGPPCLMTSLTTSAAFLSFLTSDLETFFRFGAICAFGVMACLVLTFSLLPLFLLWLPDVALGRHVQSSWSSVADGVYRLSQQRGPTVLLATGIIAIVCTAGWSMLLRIDTQPEEMFGDNSLVTRWDRFVGANLRGSDSLEIDISLPPTDPVASPETLGAVAAFEEFLRTNDGLQRVLSVRSLLARLNLALHEDDPEFDRPAATLQGNAELLEILALDDRDLLESWVTPDGLGLRISAEGLATTSGSRGLALERVREYIDERLPADWKVVLTGPFSLSYDWVNELQSTQLKSFAAAFLLVLVLMTWFLRAPLLGLAAMIPAVLPVLISLGLMAFAGMSLDVGRVMIAAIVIGIGVDDSIHLLSRYRSNRLLGYQAGPSIREAFDALFKPLVITSVALSLGFLTLTSSAWQTLSSFGFLVSLSIGTALIATLVVIPAIFGFGLGKLGRPSQAGDPPMRTRRQPARGS